MYWWLCCTGVKTSHEIAHNCCQTQGQHNTVKNYFSPMTVIDLEVDPQWNYDVTWHPRIERFSAHIAWRLSCAVWRLHFTIGWPDKLTAVHCKRQVERQAMDAPSYCLSMITFRQRVETTKREMFSQKSVRRFVGDLSAFVSDSSWAPCC